MRTINIAIDGPSGVGKSSVAKIIAKKLNLVFINTGLMYRAIGYFVLNNNINIEDQNEIDLLLKKIYIELLPNEQIKLNNVNVTSSLYNDEISLIASQVAKNKTIRDYCVLFQQNLANTHKGVVMEGRDIGSVVLPNAELKIFLTASEEIRAKRRVSQLREKYQNINEKEVLKNLIERDNQDKKRENAPLIKTKDAHEIDTSNFTLDEVIEQIILLANSKIK